MRLFLLYQIKNTDFVSQAKCRLPSVRTPIPETGGIRLGGGGGGGGRVRHLRSYSTIHCSFPELKTKCDTLKQAHCCYIEVLKRLSCQWKKISNWLLRLLTLPNRPTPDNLAVLLHHPAHVIFVSSLLKCDSKSLFCACSSWWLRCSQVLKKITLTLKPGQLNCKLLQVSINV